MNAMIESKHQQGVIIIVFIIKTKQTLNDIFSFAGLDVFIDANVKMPELSIIFDDLVLDIIGIAYKPRIFIWSSSSYQYIINRVLMNELLN